MALDTHVIEIEIADPSPAPPPSQGPITTTTTASTYNAIPTSSSTTSNQSQSLWTQILAHQTRFYKTHTPAWDRHPPALRVDQTASGDIVQMKCYRNVRKGKGDVKVWNGKWNLLLTLAKGTSPRERRVKGGKPGAIKSRLKIDEVVDWDRPFGDVGRLSRMGKRKVLVER